MKEFELKTEKALYKGVRDDKCWSISVEPFRNNSIKLQIEIKNAAFTYIAQQIEELEKTMLV